MALSAKELKTKIQAILKDADLEKTSAKIVRTQLEKDLGEDLKERKDEINGIIKEVMDEMDDGEEDEEEEDGEEEKGAKDAKKKNNGKSAKNNKDDDDESGKDDEDEEEESEEEKKPTQKKRGRAPPPKVIKKKDASSSESNFSDEKGSDNGESSEDGGSDYEPDEMVRMAKKKHKAAAKFGAKRGGRGRKRKNNSDSDESSGEEWGKAKKGRSASKKKKADSDSDGSPKPKKKRGGGGGGFTKPLQLSEDLAAIVGKDTAPRSEVVKLMWAYIKDNKLQDPKNKQFAKCDEKLMKVIGEKKFRCFGMAKYLKDHMTSL